MRFNSAFLLVSLLAAATSSSRCGAQGVTVSLHVSIASGALANERKPHSVMAEDTKAVVAWLQPMSDVDSRLHPAAAPAHTFTLTQKNKRFSPHMLVIPTGSSVEFPNLDPFFHNVFSLYNGRRFDLGLYQAGSWRSVRFDQEGVSYIFCNIHPEMGAVIVSLSTPYYGVSDDDDQITIAHVPPGDYELNVWSQNVSVAELAGAKHAIHVEAQNITLPAIRFRRTSEPSRDHLNKFGEPYKRSEQTPY